MIRIKGDSIERHATAIFCQQLLQNLDKSHKTTYWKMLAAAIFCQRLLQNLDGSHKTTHWKMLTTAIVCPNYTDN